MTTRNAEALPLWDGEEDFKTWVDSFVQVAEELYLSSAQKFEALAAAVGYERIAQAIFEAEESGDTALEPDDLNDTWLINLLTKKYGRAQMRLMLWNRTINNNTNSSPIGTRKHIIKK